jgi:hypothetical protein
MLSLRMTFFSFTVITENLEMPTFFFARPYA